MVNQELKNKIENLKRRYKSIEGDHLARDFYSPCLLASKKLKRATCDFTSSVLYQYGEALLKLVNIDLDDCQVQILAEPKLENSDIQAMQKAIDKNDRDFIEENIIEKIFKDAISIATGNRDNEKKLKVLAWLIKNKRIIIKFAFVKHVENSNLFHDKEGVFYLEWDDKKIGFNGSENETYSGLERNGGSFSVFKSWIDGQKDYVQDIEVAFDKAWEDKLPGLKTKKMNKKVLDMISSFAPTDIKKYFKDHNIKTKFEERQTINNEKEKTSIIKENYLDITDKKWSFQEKARKIFIEKRWGLLEMATGTGKTRTALAIATQLINEYKIDKIIIQMRGTDLIKQWRDNINSWTDSKINRSVNILESTANKDELESFLLNFENPEVDLLLIRQSNLPNLLDKLEKLNLEKTLIIHDEVHDLFAEKISEQILNKQEKFGYKLGLSATIEEPYDKERQKILFKEIQGIGDEPIFKYSLVDAIKDGVLVESNLEVLTYKLYKDEKADIGAAHARCQTRIKEGWSRNDAEAQRNMEVADVRKNARNKIEIFQDNIEYLKEKLKRSFIFTDEIEYGKKILNILTPYLNVKTHFQDSDAENLENFSKNKIDCIINVLKLSQGIDIQNLNTIVLFATPTGRQFIQRIGRVLRKDKNNLNKKAIIIDFFDEDDLKNENENSTDYKRYLELKKITETKYEPR
jgi:superfamily II DNA or RNA helicase